MFMNATDVRNDWSSVIDSVVREKPQFIKRTRDRLLLADFKIIESMLEAYKFNAQEYIEDDGSVTLVLDDMDLMDNGKTKEEAIEKLADYILNYAEDFYNDFILWAKGYRINHIPYVLKALMLNDIKKIGELIICRPGEI
jgi:hypothetical protein